MNKTNSELIMSTLCKSSFYNQCIFDNLLYKNENKEELQLADLVLEINDILIIIQIKERYKTKDSDERKWIKNTIFNKAKSQIKDSIVQLKNNKGIEFTNVLGQNSKFEERTIIPIIIFFNDEIDYYPKMVYSKSLGQEIHIFNNHDFEYICRNILLISDVVLYLEHRLNILNNSRGKSVLFVHGKNNSLIIKPQEEQSIIDAFPLITNDLELYNFEKLMQFKEFFNSFNNNTKEETRKILSYFIRYTKKAALNFWDKLIDVKEACLENQYLCKTQIFDDFITVILSLDIDRTTTIQNTLTLLKYINQKDNIILLYLKSNQENIEISFYIEEYKWEFDSNLEEYKLKLLIE